MHIYHIPNPHALRSPHCPTCCPATAAAPSAALPLTSCPPSDSRDIVRMRHRMYGGRVLFEFLITLRAFQVISRRAQHCLRPGAGVVGVQRVERRKGEQK